MSIKECDVSMFQELQGKSGGLVIIDVREGDEFTALSAPCAKNFPLSSLNVAEILEQLNLKGGEYAPPLYFICRSGRRSAVAASQFIQQGYENVYNLTGGMVSWQELGLPTRG